MRYRRVAPHAGAWIETKRPFSLRTSPDQSHPTRVRGLKPFRAYALLYNECVAPHAGAWIETQITSYDIRNLTVAPHAGAWIETLNVCRMKQNNKVAPHAGAWIETAMAVQRHYTGRCRTPRGCVD